MPGAQEYLLVARGVFKESTHLRQQPMEPEARRSGATGSGGGGRRETAPLDDRQKAAIRAGLETYLKPYLKA